MYPWPVHNHITSVPSPAHTDWTCHIPLQKMHQCHMCDDIHQQWRYLWSRRYFQTLNMVCINFHTPWTLSPNELMQNCTKCNVLSTMEIHLWTLITHVPYDYKNLWTVNAWTLQECYEHVFWNITSRRFQTFINESYLKEMGHIKQ